MIGKLVVRWIALLLFVVFFAACEDPGDDCTPLDVRCAGETLEVCNADNQWETVVQCTTYEPGAWRCCTVDDEVGCWPEEECK